MEKVFLLHYGGVISENSIVTGFNRFNIYNGVLVEFKLLSDNLIYKYFSYKDLDRNKNEKQIGGYYVEEEVLKYFVNPGGYTYIKLKTFKLSTSFLYNPSVANSLTNLVVDLVDVDATYAIHEADISIPLADVKFIWKKYNFRYRKDQKYLNGESEFIPPAGEIPTAITANYESTARDFYRTNVQVIFSGTFNNSIKVRKDALRNIISITLNIERIVTKIFNPFYTGSQYDATIAFIKAKWINPSFINDNIPETYLTFRNYFSNYFNYLYSNSEIIKQSAGNDRLKYLYMLSYSLPVLPIDTILDYFQIELMKDDGFEEILLNILKGISTQQSTEFLTKILERRPEQNDIGVTVWKTMFQVIYQKLFAVFFGKEIWKKIMDGFYSIWLDSEYNPYDATGEVRANFPSDPFLYTSNPATLEYKSEKFALIFSSTNYDFNFEWKFIIVTEQPYTIDDYKRTIGTYDIYQAVTIQNTSENTNNIRFPLITVNGKSSAAIPLFYLMFIDDSKYVNNISTGVEVAFDLALTFTGIGNLAKLRHLRHVNKLGRVALGLEASVPGQTLIAYELAQGVAGTVEISASVASLWINHVTNYKAIYCEPSSTQFDQAKCDWYTSFDNWMLFLQLKSTVVDVASSVALRNGARKLLSNPPSNFEPEALAIVAKFANQNFTDLKNLFELKLTGELGTNSSNVLAKLNDLPLSPINRQEEFIKDFQSASKQTLEKLDENGGDLVDYWNEIEFLKGVRQSSNFLDSYRTIKSNQSLLNHVHKGDVNITVINANSTKIVLTGLHNQVELVVPPPYVPGKWNFKNLSDVKTNIRGYRSGKIERNMADTIDPATGNPWINPFETAGREHMKVKVDDSVFWPEFHPDPIKNAQRINEEMAYAFSKKIAARSNQPNTLRFTSKASDGQIIFIFRDKLGKWSIFPSGADGF